MAIAIAPQGGKPFYKILWLILGFGVLDLISGDKCANQRVQERLASLAGVMNELEEPEVDGELLLRNATVRAQPGSQQ